MKVAPLIRALAGREGVKQTLVHVLEAAVNVVLTDSGVVHEQTAVPGVPCLTLRAHADRPITIEPGSNEVLGVGPAAVMVGC